MGQAVGYDDVVAATWLSRAEWANGAAQTSFIRLRRLPYPAVDTYLENAKGNAVLEERGFGTMREAEEQFERFTAPLREKGTPNLDRAVLSWPFEAIWFGAGTLWEAPVLAFTPPPTNVVEPDPALLEDPSLIAFVRRAPALELRLVFDAFAGRADQGFSGVLAHGALASAIDADVLDALRSFAINAQGIARNGGPKGAIIAGSLEDASIPVFRLAIERRYEAVLAETLVADNRLVSLPLAERLALTDAIIPWFGARAPAGLMERTFVRAGHPTGDEVATMFRTIRANVGQTPAIGLRDLRAMPGSGEQTRVVRGVR